jgi:hypothetical protein
LAKYFSTPVAGFISALRSVLKIKNDVQLGFPGLGLVFTPYLPFSSQITLSHLDSFLQVLEEKEDRAQAPMEMVLEDTGRNFMLTYNKLLSITKSGATSEDPIDVEAEVAPEADEAYEGEEGGNQEGEGEGEEGDQEEEQRRSRRRSAGGRRPG